MGFESILGGATDFLKDIGNLGLGFMTFDANQRNLEIARRREDNSIQRRVADLQAAGLSPVLAAGQGASSMSPVRLDSPQLGEGNPAAKYQAMESVALDMARQKQDIARSAAETQRVLSEKERVDQETKNLARENRFGDETYLGRVANQAVLWARSSTGYEQDKVDLALKQLGVTAQEISNARALLSERHQLVDLDVQQTEWAAKKVAVDQALQDLKTSRYNYDWYSKANLPTTGGLDPIFRGIGGASNAIQGVGQWFIDKFRH